MLLVFANAAPAQVPPLINYQGRIVVGSTNFNGSGQFKFALVNGNGTVTHWSNAPVSGGQPNAAVSLTVTNGLYSVLLGDTAITNMAAIPTTVFNNSDVRLRVWFSDGSGFQQLNPDQRIAAVGYAVIASNVVDGAINTAKLAPGAVTEAKLDSTLAADLARRGSTQTITGATTFSNTSNSFTGAGSGLTSLNASNLSSGILADARLSSNVPLKSAGNLFSGANTFSNLGNEFTGDGSGLILLNASALSTGTVLDARLSGNVPLLNRSSQNFTGSLGLGTNPVGKLDVSTGAGIIQLRNEGGLTPGINIASSPNAGVMRFRNRLEIWPNDNGTQAGRLDIRGTDGAPTIALDGASGEGTVKVLNITGGADIAEPFEMSDGDIPKGAVVVIDDENAGRLKLSDRAYDTRVAGIVSGANGINPGLALRQTGALDRGQNVALTGRVYALADASDAPIRPGDLLTSSETPGHVMKASDGERSHGAIIGKAMSSLREGRGTVLVLINLQ